MQSTRVFARTGALRGIGQQLFQTQRGASPFSTTVSSKIPLPRQNPSLRFNSTRPSVTHARQPSPTQRRLLSFFRRSSTTSTPPPAPGLSQRLKKLSREYGWSALGVYLALSALDFPFCFLAVRLVGTDRIGQIEHTVIDWVKGWLPDMNLGETEGAAGEAVREVEAAAHQIYDHGVDEAEKNNQGEEASTYNFHPHRNHFTRSSTNTNVRRHLDATGARVRYPQELHLHSSTLDCGGDSKGRQSVAWLGLGHWKEKGEDGHCAQEALRREPLTRIGRRPGRYPV